MGELSKRIISAIVFAAVVFGTVLYGYWGLYLLFGIVLIGSIFEFLKIGTGSVNPFVIIISVLPYFIFGYFLNGENLSILTISLLVSSVLILLTGLLFQPDGGFIKSNYALSGLVYLVLPISMVLYISMWGGDYSSFMILAIIVLNWTNDTFAYFTGRLIGKNPLFSRVSPKKTIEGSFGGLVFTLLVSYFAGDIVGVEGVNWLVLGTIIVVFGSLGDLVESLFKRHFEVKDSGTIMPGHGGFLDRFDSLILILPVIGAYLYIIKNF